MPVGRWNTSGHSAEPTWSTISNEFGSALRNNAWLGRGSIRKILQLLFLMVLALLRLKRS